MTAPREPSLKPSADQLETFDWEAILATSEPADEGRAGFGNIMVKVDAKVAAFRPHEGEHELGYCRVLMDDLGVSATRERLTREVTYH